MNQLVVRSLGQVSYSDAVLLQNDLVEQRQDRAIPDQLLLLEHPRVITIGRAAGFDQLRVGRDRLGAGGIEFHVTDRGGGATCHGPGQLVVYPIIDISRGRDIHGFLRRLESVVLATLADFGLKAHRSPGLTGVWVGRRKISAIGIRVRKWVTSHGLAVNIANDLADYRFICQCGLRDRGVTNLLAELGRAPEVGEAANVFASRFVQAFGYEKVTEEGEQIERQAVVVEGAG